MGMLVCQAVAAHELWYGASFKDSDIEQLICDAERKRARLFPRITNRKKRGTEMDKKVKGEIIKSGNIVLSGFMGSGKTTVGRRLAAALDMQFVDMDLYIEKKTGMTVKGAFRRIRRAAFSRARDRDRKGACAK